MHHRMVFNGCGKSGIPGKYFKTGGCCKRCDLRGDAAQNNVAASPEHDYDVRHMGEPNHHGKQLPCDKHDGMWFEKLLATYEERLGPKVHIFLPIREAESHLHSSINYYKDLRYSSFPKDRAHWNPLALDLGLRMRGHVQRFLDKWPFGRASRMHIIPLEQMDESLVLLRRQLGWGLRDIIYETVIHKQDMATDKTAPTYPKMPLETFSNDKLLYARLSGLFNESLRKHRQQSPSFDREVTAVGRLTQAMSLLCSHAPSWTDPGYCAFSFGLCRMVGEPSNFGRLAMIPCGEVTVRQRHHGKC